MKFFAYGMLKSDQPKSWVLPFSKSTPYVLYGYKMYMRKDNKAGMKKGEPENYIVGEVREVKWAKWPLSWLLLWFLDMNEGVLWHVYKRIKVEGMWTYLYEKSTEGCPVINLWTMSL